MKKSALILLAALTQAACDNAPSSDEMMQAAKDTATDAAGAAKEAAKNAVSEGKDLKQAASEGLDAAVDKVKETSAEVAQKVTDKVEQASASNDTGASIYKTRCAACHAAGVAGAPKLGDKAAWSARIAQGNDTMTRHAIEGFKGDKGYMPPKGGHMNLSDDEIRATVEYMAAESS